MILPSKLLLAVILVFGKWPVGERDLDILLFGLSDRSIPCISWLYVSITLPMNCDLMSTVLMLSFLLDLDGFKFSYEIELLPPVVLFIFLSLFSSLSYSSISILAELKFVGELTSFVVSRYCLHRARQYCSFALAWCSTRFHTSGDVLNVL